jgi:hypothetical protein
MADIPATTIKARTDLCGDKLVPDKNTRALTLLAGGSRQSRWRMTSCNVSMNQWQPRETVQKSAETLGWKVNRIKTDDGGYQIRGI